ncbi:YheT family hydrolase [Desulforhopalus sp. IMCC35007]|uniref:YheT family hydrolase n=1 Tax=Desulforhopalus sp. IMCC35007 TaxID=2569543 RepID=UPI0010AE5F49|nr:alpha/beta fold hydrolase [Desulforhopalus sp. IMCC35007]TKB07473.1 alpha/beta fold hydrolase [Desulforhopalus sp. IMCC35007]
MNRYFTPPLPIRNSHVQTTLTSLRVRKYLAKKKATVLKQHEQQIILNCSDGVRLLGAYSQYPAGAKGLVVLIHGWEGSADSSYMLSAGSTLFQAGYSIFRLNLRDHGESHHLNPQPFNSSRLIEVVDAVKEIRRLFPHRKCFLAGFSLGGNFAIRVALEAPKSGLRLSRIVAISPLVNPLTTTENMEDNHKIYHHYFVKKWKKSLRKKMECFPEMGDGSILLQLKTLRQMHDYFVPLYTNSTTTAAYFDTYRLKPEEMQNLVIPTQIISAKDDPITRVSELKIFADMDIAALKIDKIPYGGHCGFIENLKFDSWLDRQLVKLFNDAGR